MANDGAARELIVPAGESNPSNVAPRRPPNPNRDPIARGASPHPDPNRDPINSDIQVAIRAPKFRYRLVHSQSSARPTPKANPNALGEPTETFGGTPLLAPERCARTPLMAHVPNAPILLLAG